MPSNGGMLQKANAYWFYPDDSMNFSDNLQSVRIKIPLKNKIDLDFCQKMFKLLYPKFF